MDINISPENADKLKDALNAIAVKSKELANALDLLKDIELEVTDSEQD